MFFRWGHCIVRYIVEEGRRERAGGGGEEKKKRDAGEPFLFYCVCVLVCRKGSLHLPTLPGSRDTPTSEGHFFDVVLFVLAIITYLEYFGGLPYICSRRTLEERRRFLFLQELFHTMSGLEECRHLEKPSKVQFAGSWYVFALSTSRVD